MARRPLMLWILPLCLLLAQAGAMDHGLGHSPGESSTKERSGAADACVQCASFAKLSHVVAATHHDAIADSLDVVAHGDAPYTFLPVVTAAFEPRGPPRVL